MDDLAADDRHGDGGADAQRGSPSEDVAVKGHRARRATSAALTAGHSSAMTLK
jgi:hypothetical protein